MFNYRNEELDKAVADLRKSFDNLIKFYDSVMGLLVELVDLENTDVDKILDKYKVEVSGKYPREIKE